MELVFVFSTTNQVIRAEGILQAAGLQVGVMPLPAEIRAGCGLCLRLPPGDAEAAEAALTRGGIPVEGIYRRQVENGSSIFQLWEGMGHD